MRLGKRWTWRPLYSGVGPHYSKAPATGRLAYLFLAGEGRQLLKVLRTFLWNGFPNFFFLRYISARKILELEKLPLPSIRCLEGEMPHPVLSEIAGKACHDKCTSVPSFSRLLGLRQQLLLHVFVPKNAHVQAFWNCPHSPFPGDPFTLSFLSP